MKLKCIIIDDEPLAINVIKNHLEHVKDIEISSTFENALDALNYLNEHDIDLIFWILTCLCLTG